MENETQTAVGAMLEMAQRGWTVTLHPLTVSATENPLWFQYRLEAVFAEDRTHRKRRASIIIGARGSEVPAGMSSNVARAILSLHAAVIRASRE